MRNPIFHGKALTMTDLRESFFPHRRKLDGSYDFICLNCLATIGSETQEELERRDKEHICEPSFELERRSFRPLNGDGVEPD